MKVGYTRVPAIEHDPADQLVALKKAGCRRVFSDKGVSGRSSLPALRRCVESLKRGDALVVLSLDQLGQPVRELVALLDSLKERGIAFQSIKEGIDTSTSAGPETWRVIESLVELERSLASERTTAGMRTAKARGVQLGRRPALTDKQIAQARALIEQGEPPARVAERLGVHRATLYRAMRRN